MDPITRRLFSNLKLFSAFLIIEAGDSEKEMLLAAKTIRLFIGDLPNKKDKILTRTRVKTTGSLKSLPITRDTDTVSQVSDNRNRVEKGFDPWGVGAWRIWQENDSRYLVVRIVSQQRSSHRQPTQNVDVPETLKTMKIFFSKNNLEEIFIARVTHPDALCINMRVLGYQLELVGDSMEIVAGKQRGTRIEKYPAPKLLFRFLKWWQNKRASAKQ